MADRSERLGGAAGIACVALAVAAYLLAAPHATSDDSLAEIVERSTGDRRLVAAYLDGLAVIAFVVFLGGLRSALRRAEGEGGPFSATAVIGGSVTAALALAAVAAAAALSASADSAGDDVVRALFDVAAFLGIAFSFAAASFLLGAAGAILSVDALPRSLGWAALGTAVIQLLAAASLAEPAGLVSLAGQAVLLAWVLAAGLLLARPSGQRRE